jgi:hypothetical protein
MLQKACLAGSASQQADLARDTPEAALTNFAATCAEESPKPHAEFPTSRRGRRPSQGTPAVIESENLFEVSGSCFVPFVLGLEDELADLAHRTAAAGPGSDMMGNGLYLFHAIGN